jgi:hypothetical protein
MMVADVQPKATTWSGIFGRMRAKLRGIRGPMARKVSGRMGKVGNNFPPCRKQFIEKLRQSSIAGARRWTCCHIRIDKPDATNFILGQTHFIKSVEEIHETLVGGGIESEDDIAWRKNLLRQFGDKL